MDYHTELVNWMASNPDGFDVLPVIQDVVLSFIVLTLFLCLIRLQRQLTKSKMNLQCKLKSVKNQSSNMKAELKRMTNRYENLRKRDETARKEFDTKRSEYKTACLAKEKELEIVGASNRALLDKMDRDEIEHNKMTEQKKAVYESVLQEKEDLEKAIAELKQKEEEAQKSHIKQLQKYDSKEHSGWFLDTIKHESTMKVNGVLKRKIASMKLESDMYKSQINDCKDEIMKMNRHHDRMIDYYADCAYNSYLDQVKAENMTAILKKVLEDIKGCQKQTTAAYSDNVRINNQLQHQLPSAATSPSVPISV